MVPKSILNDLRRQAVAQLLETRIRSHPIVNPTALESLRPPPPSPNGQSAIGHRQSPPAFRHSEFRIQN